MDASSKVPVKLVKVTRVLGRTGAQILSSLPMETPGELIGKQVPVVVLRRCASSSWTIRPVPSSATSRALVRAICFAEGRAMANKMAVREDDILCLLESEREARRLR